MLTLLYLLTIYFKLVMLDSLIGDKFTFFERDVRINQSVNDTVHLSPSLIRASWLRIKISEICEAVICTGTSYVHISCGLWTECPNWVLIRS